MSEKVLTTADQVNPGILNNFLCRFYPTPKSDFLKQNGKWQHRQDHNRWVLLVNGELAGYCAVIPTRLWIHGEVQPAIWWVDLILAPKFRGQGLQSLFDQKIRQMADLKVGFPNVLAAQIHRKHQWGVREDLRVLLMPLQPQRVNQVRKAADWRRFILQVGATLLSPWASWQRRFLSNYHSNDARRIKALPATLLAGVFDRYRNLQDCTTLRDPAYIQWRFLDSPKRHEYTFYTAGPADQPTHYLVARHMDQDGIRVTRLLDLYGDFQDVYSMKEMVWLAAQDASQRGSVQVTILTSLPEMKSWLRSVGFLFSSTTRFCWYSASPDLMQAFTGRGYWTLADSDNDSPE